MNWAMVFAVFVFEHDVGGSITLSLGVAAVV